MIYISNLKIKYLGINLKYVQDPYEENYITIVNKIKQSLNKWEEILS